MDDENRNPFTLDSRIIVPIAIAGGVAFVIIVFLYCCRHFVYNKRLLGNRVRSGGVRPGAYSTPTRSGAGGSQLGGSRVSAFQHQFMPWSVRGYQRNASEQQSSTHNRANYNSTQTTTRTNHEHEESTGPIPSAPQVPVADAPPSYSIAVKFPRASATNTNSTDHPYISAPPPPYSSTITTQ